MKQDLRYTHESVFETFPFSNGVLDGNHSALAMLGQQFFETRQYYMVSHNKGMTKFYNDFHEPSIRDTEIEKFRSFQIRLNDEVLAAYGFDDIDPQYGFHQVAYLPDGKNTRFTVSETAREELLHRLAMLNKERHEQEDGSKKKDGRPASKKQGQLQEGTDDLFSSGGMR